MRAVTYHDDAEDVRYAALVAPMRLRHVEQAQSGSDADYIAVVRDLVRSLRINGEPADVGDLPVAMIPDIVQVMKVPLDNAGGSTQ